MNISNATNYKPKDFSKLLNVTVRTLQKWDREGILVANRTPTNRRYYTHKQYLDFSGITEKTKGKTIIYSRVSTKNQSDNLENQVDFLQDFANARGWIIDNTIRDYGSGLNYNRKKWNQLIEEVMTGNIDKILISHRDRFVRFGFEWFENFCSKFGTEIVVVNNDKLSLHEELVQDIISILHMFSCRIYGLRKYKNKIKDDEDIAKSI